MRSNLEASLHSATGICPSLRGTRDQITLIMHPAAQNLAKLTWLFLTSFDSKPYLRLEKIPRLGNQARKPNPIRGSSVIPEGVSKV